MHASRLECENSRAKSRAVCGECPAGGFTDPSLQVQIDRLRFFAVGRKIDNDRISPKLIFIQ